MSQEQYNMIIDYAKNNLNKEILEKITEFKYSEVDGYYVIQVYIKESIKAKEMGEILIKIEDYAKSSGTAVLVDFLRG
ncbi:hypothetical protein [uncultured Clostridium sp.]|uniref:hypothetical protein n=1 Tax=uncultured Clostridium sp. TaxID=59620 RepID=UPI00262C3A52|nr:hypothetical protein [uncultured Clostridium sp.]